MGYDVTLFPTRVKRARKARGLSQLELAVEIGIEPYMISRYESGQHLPGVGYLAALAIALQVTPGWLLGYTKERG